MPAPATRYYVALLLFCLFLLCAEVHAQQSSSQKWEGAIEKFEAADADEPPLPHGILFIGSSSIRMWDLKTHFPDRHALNRGFGGSRIRDSVFYANRVIHPYAPRVIVLYAGDNDIASGLTPEQVAADYRRFVKAVHEKLPKTRIVFIAIKPSIKRWSLVEKMRTANALIRKETEGDERLSFVDIDTPMIGEDGKPRPELFVKDGLHLSEAGYQLWSKLVRPHLTD